MRRFSLFAALLLPGALAAQTHPLVGTWDVNVPAGMRMENGEATPIMAKGTLTFSVAADSLIGMLKTDPIEGQPERPAKRIAAKLVTGAVTFVAKGDAKMTMNGEEMTRTVISTYVFDVADNALKGSIERAIEGLDVQMGGPQPITGTRAKG
jgi:hypothetical protein